MPLSLLNEYAQALGQCINADMTTMVFSKNVKDVDKTKISAMWDYSEMKPYEKYLGLPPIFGRSKNRAFYEIKIGLWQCL